MPNLPLPEHLSTTKLECVMLDIEPLDIHGAFGDDLDEDDFFYGTIPELKYAQGPVAEKQAHLTLLFGIHPSPSYRRSVDAVLKGWKPEPIKLTSVIHFPSPIEGQDYNYIVAKVEKTPNVLEARARLAILDHTDRYPEYQPHVSLAVIKGSAPLGEWIKRMDTAFAGRTYEPGALDYGD